MIERLIASTAIAMGIITFGGLGIALGAWIKGVFQELNRKREAHQQMLLEMRKAIDSKSTPKKEWDHEL